MEVNNEVLRNKLIWYSALLVTCPDQNQIECSHFLERERQFPPLMLFICDKREKDSKH